jgi:hypothetical protein
MPFLLARSGQIERSAPAPDPPTLRTCGYPTGGRPSDLAKSASSGGCCVSEGPSRALFVRDQSGGLRGATTTEIISAARHALSRRVRRGASLTSPRLVRDFLSLKLGALEHESFAVLLLDNRHRLIDYVELFRGTIDGASVHPREVLKLALTRNAAAVVFAHPHPLCCVAMCHPGDESSGRSGETPPGPVKRRGLGMTLFFVGLPRRSCRQGAARPTPWSFRCSPESLREPMTAALRREGNPRGQSRPCKS